MLLGCGRRRSEAAVRTMGYASREMAGGASWEGTAGGAIAVASHTSGAGAPRSRRVERLATDVGRLRIYVPALSGKTDAQPSAPVRLGIFIYF